jgi:hypothetical protein
MKKKINDYKETWRNDTKTTSLDYIARQKKSHFILYVAPYLLIVIKKAINVKCCQLFPLRMRHKSFIGYIWSQIMYKSLA